MTKRRSAEEATVSTKTAHYVGDACDPPHEMRSWEEPPCPLTAEQLRGWLEKRRDQVVYTFAQNESSCPAAKALRALGAQKATVNKFRWRALRPGLGAYMNHGKTPPWLANFVESLDMLRHNQGRSGQGITGAEALTCLEHR